MPRISPAARAAAIWKTGGQKPRPPKHLSADAKRIWSEIVDDRPADWFRPGSLLMLEQLCEVMVAQRKALMQLAKNPNDPDTIRAVKDFAAIVNGTAVKLRLSVQADVDRRSRRVDEKEPGADVLLLGGWEPPA
jgi:phage terminase small subunit